MDIEELARQNTASVETLNKQLEEARLFIDEQENHISHLLSPPLKVATLVAKHEDTLSIAIDGGFYEVLMPADEALARRLSPGDTVHVNSQSLQIVSASPSRMMGGDTALLRRVINGIAEVDHQGNRRIVYVGGNLGEKPLEEDDKVTLDRSGTVITANLGKEDTQHQLTADTGVTWDDLGGLEEAKRQLIEAVELPHSNPELFAYYNKRPAKGILLWGPPGCGKTMLGKAAASAISRIYGKAGAAGFLSVKGPEILDRYVGVAEANIRNLFKQATEFKRKHSYPAVLFIDEADAILGRRGTGISSDMDRTIVPMFLAEMDGLAQSSALVILVTNRPDVLDPAVVREGRIDTKIKIDRPDRAATCAIIKLHMKDVPVAKGASVDDLADTGSHEVWSKSHVICEVKTRTNGICKFLLRHMVSGSLAANIVDRATSMALRRDLSDGQRRGVAADDIKAAVQDIYRQVVATDHSDAIADFAGGHREVVSVATVVRG